MLRCGSTLSPVLFDKKSQWVVRWISKWVLSHVGGLNLWIAPTHEKLFIPLHKANLAVEINQNKTWQRQTTPFSSLLKLLFNSRPSTGARCRHCRKISIKSFSHHISFIQMQYFSQNVVVIKRTPASPLSRRPTYQHIASPISVVVSYRVPYLCFHYYLGKNESWLL